MHARLATIAVQACRCITAEDLREGLGAVGKQMDRESIKKLARELDVSGCGSINLEEFIAGAMDRKRALTSETLTRVFSDLDDDHDGELGPRVFASALQVRPCVHCFWIALIERSCGGEKLLSC